MGEVRGGVEYGELRDERDRLVVKAQELLAAIHEAYGQVALEAVRAYGETIGCLTDVNRLLRGEEE